MNGGVCVCVRVCVLVYVCIYVWYIYMIIDNVDTDCQVKNNGASENVCVAVKQNYMEGMENYIKLMSEEKFWNVGK